LKFGVLDTLEVNLGFLLGRLLGLDGEQFLGFGRRSHILVFCLGLGFRRVLGFG